MSDGTDGKAKPREETMVICEDCNGEGYVPCEECGSEDMFECSNCDGNGEVPA